VLSLAAREAANRRESMRSIFGARPISQARRQLLNTLR
jgi:hypothetical protein